MRCSAFCPPTFAFTKSCNENGPRDAVLGLTTSYQNSAAHQSAANAAFTARLAEIFPGSVANLASMGAHDGMEVLYRMVAAAGPDGPAAIEAIHGARWVSPRGPVSIDAESRHITQNVHIREVAKDEAGKLINRACFTSEAVSDLGLTPN